MISVSINKNDHTSKPVLQDLKLRAEIRKWAESDGYKNPENPNDKERDREREIQRRKKGTKIEGLITCIEIEGLVLINGVGSVADSGEDDE